MTEPKLKRPRVPRMTEAEALAELRRHVTVGCGVAGPALGVGKEALRRGLEDGTIPSLKLGREFRVPSAKLLVLLGLPVEPELFEEPAEPALIPDEGP